MTDKFCKDCKHFRPDALAAAGVGKGTGRCFRPVGLRRKDLVFGAREAYLDNVAWLERAEIRAAFKWLFRDQCGPNGKYFDPKKACGEKSA